jgi:sentrin-specific protease 1
VIKFNQQKFVNGKHRKVGDFLLKKIIQIHAKDKQRRERMKIRAQHQSRPSVSSHLKTAMRSDKLIKRKELELPLKKQADEIIAAKEREERERAVKGLAIKLMSPLMAKERSVVIGANKGVGLPTEILASQDASSVQSGSMQTLCPGQWLKGEVINYFPKICLKWRNKKLCKKALARRRLHFFNSFFVQTMFDEKNNDPKLRGRYNYKNLRHWPKNVPGKDIFNLSKVFIPINLDNEHWTLAVIFMEEKKIQYYDLLGGTNRTKSEWLLEYVKYEYRAKNEKEMDVTDWKLVSCTRDTPRQRNGG